ncbi:MAG: aldo/keto reductase [Planctomycetota bacterium]
MTRNKMNRRGFLKAGAMGLAGAPFLSGCSAPNTPDSTTAAPKPVKEEVRVRKYNVLGKTGLNVSDISLGGAREPSVLHYALDKGINLYDTAEQYFQGEHEADLGRAFKHVRDKVFIITKHTHGLTGKITRQNIIDRFDASLRRMESDYVDIAMLHHVADPEIFQNEEILSAYETLKKAGKFRFLGFSTHDADRVCDAAYASGLFSVMLLIYNSIQFPNRSELITRAKEHGIGVLAMKTMMGRQQDRIVGLVNDRTTFSQAAMKWALTDPGVTSVCISMRTFEHIEEYLQASGKTLTPEDEAVLGKYVAAVDHEYCRIGCTACLESCPQKIAIHDIMRFGMYYENYGDEKKALLEYAALEKKRRADACSDCTGLCESACPHSLSIRERLMRYDSLLRI